MKHFPSYALALSLTLVAACGAGSGSVTTSLSGEKSGLAPAPAFTLAAKPDATGNPGGAADASVTGAVSAVILQVEKIAAHRSDASGSGDAEGSEKDGTNGWEVLSGAKEIDLMKAATDATEAVLGTSDLEAGKYTQIRLYLKDAGNVVIVNGVAEPLTVPSGALKLVGNADVAADKAYKLEIKLDLDKSLVVNAQGYKLKPTVKYLLTEK
jgi:hypothetical protein